MVDIFKTNGAGKVLLSKIQSCGLPTALNQTRGRKTLQQIGEAEDAGKKNLKSK